MACGDAYGRATALADPIRAAFERGEVGSAHRMMDEALASGTLIAKGAAQPTTDERSLRSLERSLRSSAAMHMTIWHRHARNTLYLHERTNATK